MKALLEKKKSIAKKRPFFARSDAYKRVRLPMEWRRPRGNQSKIRLKRRGKIIRPGPCMRSPRLVRGLTMKGLRPIEIATVKDLEKLDAKTDLAVIKRVGQKRRIELLNMAMQKKIMVQNIRKPEEYLKIAEEELKKRKEANKNKRESKKQKKEESLKNAKDKDKEKKEEKEEEKKPETSKGSKSEKIKTLEKKQ